MSKVKNIGYRADRIKITPINPLNASTGRRIDRRHDNYGFEVLYPDTTKLRVIRAEYRYATPPNVGNARNPLIFGKIPKQFIEQEKNENMLALRRANNTKHRVYRIPKRKLLQTL